MMEKKRPFEGRDDEAMIVLQLPLFCNASTAWCFIFNGLFFSLFFYPSFYNLFEGDRSEVLRMCEVDNSQGGFLWGKWLIVVQWWLWRETREEKRLKKFKGCSKLFSYNNCIFNQRVFLSLSRIWHRLDFGVIQEKRYLENLQSLPMLLLISKIWVKS